MGAIDKLLTQTDEEKKKGTGVSVVSRTEQATPVSKGGGSSIDKLLSQTKTQSRTAAEGTKPITEAVAVKAEEPKKGFFARAGNAILNVGKKALDVFNETRRKNDEASFPLQEIMYGKQQIKVDPATGQKTLTTERLERFNAAKTSEEKAKIIDEFNQEVPLVKFFNSPTGKKVVGTISEKSSNIPLKTAARIKAIGNQTYEEAYSALLAERNDPTNPTWQKFLYELQDTGIQTAIGAVLAIGTSAATRNPNAGYAVSGAFYTALSADEQIQQRGQVDSIGNIAIDVVGDQMLNKLLGGIFIKGASKSTIIKTLEGFGVEGSTEVAQSLLKYTNDYGNARTEEEKQKVLDEAKLYITSGAIAMEFAVGGVAGATITGGASAIDALLNPSSQPKKGGNAPTTEKAPDEIPVQKIPNTSQVQAEVENVDINSARDELVKLTRTGDVTDPAIEARLTGLRDILGDYSTAFDDKTIYVPSETTDAPLVEVITTTFPDGKVAVKFSANTDTNGIASEYDFGQLFSSQEAATKNARDAIIAWARSQDAQTPEEAAQYEKIIDYAQNPRAPISENVDRSVTTQDGVFTEEETQALALYTNKLALQGENAGVETFNDGDVVSLNGKQWRIISQFDTQGDTKYRLLPIDARAQLDAKKKKKSDKKTQKEQVEQAVMDKPKTIQEVSQETGILEPNVRRILGVGAKDGTFTRVDKGVYVLSKDGVDTAYIYPEDAIETLPKLAREGFKADMVFLDIPYDTPAVRGGNRGVKYNLISVDQFKTLVKAVSDITRNDDTPVFHMFSQAKSGMKKMEQYNKVLVDAGFKPIARGDYTKLQKDGVTRVRNMRGAIIEPEGLLLFTKSGKFDVENPNLNFTLVRPKGYQTEKPAEMIKALIEMSTKEGDVVLDPFAGSGVVGAEAVKADRKAVLIEKDKEVVKKFTVPRVEEAIKEKKTTKKTGTHEPIRSVGGEKVVTPTSKTIYKIKGVDTARVFKGNYNGKEFTTNSFVLELKNLKEIDAPEVDSQKKEATEKALKTLFDSAESNKNELGQPSQYIKTLGGVSLVFDTPNGKIPLSSDFYNYFAKQYPAMRLVAGNTRNPVTVYDGDTMVGLIMPQNLDDRTFNEAIAINKDEGKVKEFKAPSGSGQASAGIWENGEALLNEDARRKSKLPQKKTVEVEMGGLEYVNPIELPELVDLARELMGNVPSVVKKSGNAAGRFYSEGNGRIKLIAELFSKGGNHLEAARTLAHEIGHLIDYLPDQTLKRGNMLGRLASLRGFMSETFSFEKGKSLPKEARDNIRKEIRKEFATRLEKKQADFTDAEKQQIAKEYKKRVNETIKTGGYVRDAKIRKELLTVTRWWHPYNPDKVPASYKAYRESSVELYAEAISVLFNAPQRLQEMAPTFYENFFASLDAKPDVRDAYFEIQALLSGDRELVIERRRQGVKKMFKDGDYKAIELHNKQVQEKETRRKQYWAHFKHTVIDKNYQIIDRVKKVERSGKTINPDENPAYFLEERNYIGGKIKAVFEREFNSIYNTLNENQISWEDFGETLFYSRIAAGDRSDVANPRGITPDAAKELVQNVAKPYTAEQRDILVSQVEKFHQAIKKVNEEAFEAGLYTPELYQNMQENPAYVTFQVLDHLEDGMTSRVYKSLGTLKDIANPADATMLKIITTIRASERNKTTKATVDFLLKEFSGEIEEAKYTRSAKGRFPIPSRKPNQELVTFFDQGKIKGYYVDPYIAESINNQSVGSNAPIVPAIRFMNSTFFRPLFISFNLGFQSFNLIRDFVRFYKNVPSMTFLRAIKRYGQAGRIARIRAFGLPKNPTAKDVAAYDLLNQLEEDKVLSVTFNDLIKGETNVDKQIEKILADTGIKDFQPKPRIERVPKFAKPAVKALDKTGILDAASNILGFIENLGNLIETLPKAAGVFELQQDGQLTKEQKSFIRRKIGSPDFLAGGTYKPITNEVFLFSNAIIQGIRSDIEVASDPKTRSGWWWKTTKIAFLPKILMMAVLYGAFGDEYKELMEGATEYDKTNYTIIPVGRDSTGKPVYIRVPADETSRFLSGVFWKMLNLGQNESNIGQDLMDVVSYTGGQLPSISPTIQSFTATTQFLAGQNPYDWFRGRNVISDTTFKAGGIDATKSFLGWQFQQLGGGIFYRFYHEPTAPKEEGVVEKIFNLPIIGNVAGRFVRVSDYGQTEKLKSIEKKVEKEQARQTIEERKLISKYIKEARERNIRFNFGSIENEMIREAFDGRPKTKEEVDRAKRLVKKFEISYKRGEADGNTIALIDANTNNAKLELLKRIKKDMSDDEFSTYRRQLIDDNIVSKTVFEQLIIDERKEK